MKPTASSKKRGTISTKGIQPTQLEALLMKTLDLTQRVRKPKENRPKPSKPKPGKPKQDKKSKMPQNWKQKLSQFLPQLGASLGGLAGPAGGAVGGLLGKMGSNILGKGQYSINDGAKKGALMKGSGMSRVTNSIISHEEFIGTFVVNSGANAQSVYSLNPANSATHPWLNYIATLYDRFDYLQVVFKVRSLTNAATTTNTAYGEILLNNFYDPTETVPADKVSLMMKDQCTMFKSIDDFDHGFECKNTGPGASELPQYFVADADNSGQDPRWLYPGKVSVSVFNPLGATTSYDLYIEYSVRLVNPKLPNGGQGGNVPTDYFIGTTNGTLLFSNTTSNKLPEPGSSINGYFQAGANVYRFPTNYNTGYYMVILYNTDNLSSKTPYVMTPTSGSLVPIWKWVSGMYNDIRYYSATGFTTICCYLMKITDSNALLTFSIGTNDSGSNTTVFISQVNPLSVTSLMKNSQDNILHALMKKFTNEQLQMLKDASRAQPTPLAMIKEIQDPRSKKRSASKASDESDRSLENW